MSRGVRFVERRTRARNKTSKPTTKGILPRAGTAHYQNRPQGTTMRMLIVCTTIILVAMFAALVRADTTTCRKDSGGHTVCSTRHKAEIPRRTTCRKDSGGNTICR